MAFRAVPYGESTARCDCRTPFRNAPEGVLPKAHYDTKGRDRGLARRLKNGISIERAWASLRRAFLRDLSSGFVSDGLRDPAAELDMAPPRRLVLGPFSGTLGVAELPLGRFTVLLATVPLADLPVAFALVAKDDPDPRRRFLRNLKTGGLRPRVVVTDGSNRDPAVLAELWPEADPPLGVFPVARASHKLILDAVRRRRTARRRRGGAGRKKKRGRQSQKAQAAARRGPSVPEKASFVFRPRPLIGKRRETLTQVEREDLTRTLESLPALATWRRFADRVSWLFDSPQDLHPAGGRRAALVRDPEFQAVPAVVKTLEQLAAAKLPKRMAYLKNPLSRRVRTNNHGERTNRRFRFLEKVRSTWRHRRTLVRFVVLRLNEVWSPWVPPRARKTDPQRAAGRPESRPHAGQRSRRAA